MRIQVLEEGLVADRVAHQHAEYQMNIRVGEIVVLVENRDVQQSEKLRECEM